MRSASTFQRAQRVAQDWASRDSLEEMTEIYVRPEDRAPSASLMPGVRVFEVPNDDRYAVPELAASPAGSAPRMSSLIGEPTIGVRRMPRAMFGAAFAGCCIALGVVLGGITVLGSRAASSAPAVAVAHVTAPAPAPAPAPEAKAIVMTVAAAPVAAKHVTVRLESNPAGATAMLVEDGKTALLGSTPIDIELDPARTYDLIFTHDGFQSHVEHIDAAAKDHVTVELAAVAADIAPRHGVAPAAPVKTGTLALSSKPACSIVIDGRATGLVTPQASITLPAGSHEITLTNADEGIHLTTTVEVTADHTAQLAQDFTK